MDTIFLEFKHEAGNLAANGTEVTFHIDGRWSAETRRAKIYERVAELRASSPVNTRYQKQLFVGFTYAGARGGCISSMADPNPPSWFTEKTPTQLAADVFGQSNVRNK